LNRAKPWFCMAWATNLQRRAIMQVKEVMSSKPEFLSADATIAETARRMREMNTGFAPIAENDQIIGIVTDRDLVLRAMADGKSLDDNQFD
jgi:CBS domain-containing protein